MQFPLFHVPVVSFALGFGNFVPRNFFKDSSSTIWLDPAHKKRSKRNGPGNLGPMWGMGLGNFVPGSVQGLVFHSLAGSDSRKVDGEKGKLKSNFFEKKKTSVKFLSALVKVHLCIPTSRNFAMHMGKVLTGCRPPLLSSQAGGQGHYVPLSQIISGKEFVP